MNKDSICRNAVCQRVNRLESKQCSQTIPYNQFRLNKSFTTTHEVCCQESGLLKIDKQKNSENGISHNRVITCSSPCKNTFQHSKTSTTVNSPQGFICDFNTSKTRRNSNYDIPDEFSAREICLTNEKRKRKVFYKEHAQTNKRTIRHADDIHEHGESFLEVTDPKSEADCNNHKESHCYIPESLQCVGDPSVLSSGSNSKEHFKDLDRRSHSLANCNKRIDNDKRENISAEKTATIQKQMTLVSNDEASLKFRIPEEETSNLTQTKAGVTVNLLNSSLWKAFHEIGTEMIINRGGRRMFPYLALSVNGLDADSQYNVSLYIVPAASRRFKYINNKWIPVGLADSEALQTPHVHQDSPNSGAFWNHSKITFSKVKLTNNFDSGVNNILLHSMHKYRIVTTFKKLEDNRVAGQTVSFTFPETDFMTVTAYQNEAVTQMKIHNNPFAKAFRDANFSSIRRINEVPKKRKNNLRIPETSEPSEVKMPQNYQLSSGLCDSMSSFVGQSLQAYHLNAYTIGDFGLHLAHTPSAMALNKLNFCLPWNSISFAPSPLCTSLLPGAASTFGTSLATGSQYLAMNDKFKGEARSRIYSQSGISEGRSLPTKNMT